MRAPLMLTGIALAGCGRDRFQRETDWCPDDFNEAAHEGLAEALCTYVQNACPGVQPDIADACTNGGAAGLVEYYAQGGDCVIPCNVRTCYFNLRDAVKNHRCDPSALSDPLDACYMVYFRFRGEDGNLTCGDEYGGVYWEAP